MKRDIILTRDGSHTIAIDEWSVMYHSVHGAIQESTHVFIRSGLDYVAANHTGKVLQVFEMGFGTGLNAFLTALETERRNLKMNYTSIEQYPLTEKETESLNYPDQLGHKELFHLLHKSDWNKEVKITEQFTLYKVHGSLHEFDAEKQYNLIYFDAFAPSAQPEMWTEEVFKRMYSLLVPGGVLVTYCSKSIIRRAMRTAGLNVTKISGPPGKREIVRAFKT